MKPLLEVVVHRVDDVAGAVEGGADRLSLDAGGRSPDVPTASAVLRAAAAVEVPVRVVLRLDDTFTTTGADLVRLTGLAHEYLALGAEGLVLGFLDTDLEIDVETTLALVDSVPGVPWTFHRAIDATLDPARSWRRLVGLPGLTAVASAGSPQGLAQGYDDLLALAGRDPDVARLLLPTGGLSAEQVPWLVRAGVGQLQVGAQVRPGGAANAYVDAALVRSWRLLLDHPPMTRSS
ncbi:copper homeostasis protein CutC [Nocardioides rubriscoriae]|uniref:copper homeostasis protein CutC n=1 Tax=Nocardioides rubriscoriae TaxID=642762 RepID=UPI0011E04CD1|nr:copper homeostasis protein CutC [Nocardioides rubriscoriae]